MATITLKELDGGAENIYAVEALEINQDADSEVHLAEQYPRGLNSAPIQNLASQLGERIAYYVGDVNRTRPAFVNDATSFSIPTAVEKLLQMLGSPPGLALLRNQAMVPNPSLAYAPRRG